MEFEIRKGRFSFRLTAPYSEERRRAASEAAKKCGVHRKVAHLYGDRNRKVRNLHGIIILDSYIVQRLKVISGGARICRWKGAENGF